MFHLFSGIISERTNYGTFFTLFFVPFPRSTYGAKTSSEMDVAATLQCIVAPWKVHWILMVSDGVTWHLIVFFFLQHIFTVI